MHGSTNPNAAPARSAVLAGRTRRAALLAPLAALALTGALPIPMMAPPPAAATFAGANGRILVTSTLKTPDNPEGDNELFTIKADGTGIKQLTENTAQDFDAVVSKDRKKIAFVSNRDGDDEIFVMNVDGSGVVQLTKNTVDDADPSWAPQVAGTPRIAFASDRDGDMEIYSMDADDGGNVLQVTKNTVGDFDPAWGPQGNTIAFVSNRTGNLEIFTANSITGDNPVNLTQNPASDYDPAWSPDGTKLAFASTRDGNEEVYTMTAAGADPTNRSDSNGTDEAPVWSPDGKQIAFMSPDANGYNDVWVMRANGADQKQLTKNSETFDYPSDWLVGPKKRRPKARTDVAKLQRSQADEDRTGEANQDGPPARDGDGGASADVPAAGPNTGPAGDGADRRPGKEGNGGNR